MIASELYLKTLEYFKPKQARQTIVGEGDSPVQIIISDKLWIVLLDCLFDYLKSIALNVKSENCTKMMYIIHLFVLK